MEKIVIAIDGHSACGKSSTAKKVAKQLGYIYLDSGAMYRAATLYILRNNVSLSDAEQVDKAVENILDKGPEKETEKEETDNCDCRQFVDRGRKPDHPDNNR